MINWGNFSGFFSTGVPSGVLYASLAMMAMIILVVVFLGIKRLKSSRKIWRNVLGVLLAEYLFVVTCSTVVFRGVQSFKYARLELTPFWTYEAVIKHTPGVSVWDIVLNMVLFMPLGFLIKLLSPSISFFKILVFAILCSLFIETNQYIFEKGIAQFDDVMHNTIGAVIGWYFARMVMNLNTILQK